MQDWDDKTLLREYVEGESEQAFTVLVSRHVNKVYSVALRLTRDPHQAEDITQTVFVLLSVKARRLSPKIILAGWLHETTRLTAITSGRANLRRARREEESLRQAQLAASASDTWNQIAPLLDSAIAELNETDRSAVVLRFFDVKSMREVGTAIGASEEAAKKRINRALEKLRLFFLKHGVNSTTALLGESISLHSAQAAPPELVKIVAGAALRKAAACGQVSTLLKETVKIMAWNKTKISLVTGLALLFAGGMATVVVNKVTSPKILGAPAHVGFNKIFLGPSNPGIELYSEAMTPSFKIEPVTRGDGEDPLKGWHYWFHGVQGAGFLYVDTFDAASGRNDLTLGNTMEGPENRADWRSEKFSLGPAMHGAATVTFSFAYKIPGPVKDGENLMISLRFIDSGGHTVVGDRTILLGSASHDANMAGYKGMIIQDIRPPKTAVKADVRIMANLEGQIWTSGPARFDEFAVTTPSSFWGKLFH